MRSAAILFSLILALLAQTARAECEVSGLPDGTKVAEMTTPLGSICIELFEQHAPQTVANFVWYLENGQIDDTFINWSFPADTVHGGRFRIGAPGDVDAVPVGPGGVVPFEPCDRDIPDPSSPGNMICSEYGNERGTITLYKNQVDGGTTGWFFNLSDNRTFEDEFFTAFGRVLGDGMDVVDQMANYTGAGSMWYGPGFPDVGYWMDPNRFVPVAINSPRGFPLLAPPIIHLVQFVLGGAPAAVPCFNPYALSLVVDHTDPAIAARDESQIDLMNLPVDPETGIRAWFVSPGCGTATIFEDFVPNPGSGQCNEPDRLAVELAFNSPWKVLTGELVMRDLIQPPATEADWVFTSFTCEQMETAVELREAWRDDFATRHAAQLVTIDSTALTTVPEPGATLLGGGALFALALLRRRSARG